MLDASPRPAASFPRSGPTRSAPASGRPSAGLRAALAAWLLAAGAAGAAEMILAGDERAKLDTFEGVTIDKADKVFAAKEYPRAVAEYDAFILQFPESKAIPYAIHQKARSLQLLDKRFEAIKVYQEVLDFFPNDVRHAASALYRIGECHSQNGDLEKSIKSWLEMADDPDYVQQPLGAYALNALAENYLRQDKVEEGIKRYEQVAIQFRRSNGKAAEAAIDRVVPHYVRTKPDVKRLHEFYRAVGGFGGPPEKGIPEDPAADPAFWRMVRGQVKRNDSFTDVQKDARDAYFRYWAGQLQGRYPEDDAYQIDLASFIRAYERDDKAWAARIDKQFAAGQKEGDFARVIRFMRVFSGMKEKIEEYYRKFDFAKMSNNDIRDLTYALMEAGVEPGMSRNTFDKLRLGDMTDDAKLSIHHWMREHSQLPGTRPLAIAACLACTDQVKGRMTLLRFHHGRASPNVGSKEDLKEGLTLAAEMQKIPECSREAYSIGGNLLQWSGKYEEAIKAYQLADNPPQTLFWTADCLASLGRLEQAVAQLREIENFFKDRAPEAAMRIANLYRHAGIRDKYVRTLRSVLKKYPKSGQSSEAHQRLEEMGLPIGGGVDAEEP